MRVKGGNPPEKPLIKPRMMRPAEEGEAAPQKALHHGPQTRGRGGGCIAAQVLGGAAGAFVLIVIASGQTGFSTAADFAANGFGKHSPGGYSPAECFVTEFVMTFFFLLVILGATTKRAMAGFAPLAIGLCLTLIHLVSIPVANTSVSPARSTGPALFAGGWALAQLQLDRGSPAHTHGHSRPA